MPRPPSCSNNFLSAIFGIFGKFAIGIGNDKFSLRKIFVEQKCSSKKLGEFPRDRARCHPSDPHHQLPVTLTLLIFEIHLTFPQTKQEIDEYFCSTKNSRREKFSLPIPIANFPKIPKIALRKFYKQLGGLCMV